MANIYELTEQQRDILDSLLFLDDTDQEDAEQIELLNKKLAHVNGSAEDYVRFMARLWAETKALVSSRDEVLKRAQKRKKSAENAEERIKQRILEVMASMDIKKVDDDLIGVSRYLSAGSVCFDDSYDVYALPDELITVIPSELVANKTEIAKVLKKGEFVQGCQLVKKDVIKII